MSRFMNISEKLSVRILFANLCLILISWNSSQAQSKEGIVTFTVDKPSEVNRGDVFQIEVMFHVAPEWYIYAPTGLNAAQGMIETNVVFMLPKGIRRTGKMKLSEPVFKNGHEILEGDSIRMSQKLTVSESLKQGEYAIKGKVTWQTCNNDICLPPVTEEINAIIQVK